MVPPHSARLTLGILYADTGCREEAIASLCSRFGPLDSETLEFPFVTTDYYTAEMGRGLKRFFCSFRDPVRREDLPEIKVWTGGLESSTAEGGKGERKRRVNLDPGLLCLDNLVLATTKSYSHRIYLDRGIFAELALLCEGREFRPLPWTYPDYRSCEALDFFNALRVNWRNRLRGGAGNVKEGRNGEE